MSPHRCNYCFKTIATAPGVKRHIAQSARCQLQWKEELRQLRSVIDGVHHEPAGTPEDGFYGSDGGDDAPDLHEGPIVQRHCVHAEADAISQQAAATKHVSVGDDIDEEPNLSSGGCFTRGFEGVAAKIIGTGKTRFESLKEVESVDCSNMWAPFRDEEEWELARFLMKNLGQNKTDEFLKLGIIGPAWTCEIIDVVGDVVGEDSTAKHEQLELWRRDPVECVEELIGNPAFRDLMAYEPERAYADKKGENRIYDEMWTGDWWWDMQTRLPEGAVVAPVILSSDKTCLSLFSGDKKAWPVYLTIGNISKDMRWQVSAHATVLIGYLPVSSLECFQKKTRSLAGYRLFHHAMSLVLQPLVDAGRHGREMICADGYLRRVHPILAAYVVDFPEQCLVACNKESRCPRCLVETDKCGDLEECAWRSMAETLRRKQKNKQSRKFDALGLRVVYRPFWKDLPFTDIFACITPDILHQLHKGVFHDHLVQWCLSLMGEKEIDLRFQSMTRFPALRHFKKGISMVSQWMGTEQKEMQRVFVGLLSGMLDNSVLLLARSLLDFIYYAQFQQHTDTSLKAMQDSLKTFHDYKHVLVELEVRQDFNIPKLHSLQHYIASIRALGSADGYNTEYLEHLHIDYAKDAYRASNKRDYVEQMAMWLQRQEAIHYKTYYKVAKVPPHRQVSVDRIRSEYNAHDFMAALEHFLCAQSTGQRQAIRPIESDRFDVYNQLYTKTGPSTIAGRGPYLQKIRASPKVVACGRKAEIPARFDTVFVREEGRQRVTALVPNAIRVAQVRVIFNLPDHLGSYPHPLAYMEWFTALLRHDPVTGLYVVSRSTRNRRPNVSVVGVDRFIRACHLQAICGRQVSTEWTSDDVLEKASSFHVNSYIDLDTFSALAYS
ncbi:Zn-finger domain-containing protein [Pisolithus albus]|nr:Zn-finger domain-containing protein [Pisolithus albus]